MNTSLNTLLALCLLLICAEAKAQSVKTDSIYWENGNVTLLSDLNKAWIILKKGDDLKDVRVREIKKEKGVLVYEKDKCLHDIFINNIKRIEPGKYSLNSLFFYPDNTPYIKEIYQRMDGFTEWSTFKSIKMPKPAVIPEPVAQPKPVEAAVAAPQEFTPASTVSDTIIDIAGNITLAKVLDVNAKFISYKKTVNMDGPVYIKANTNAIITRHDECVTIKFSQK